MKFVLNRVRVCEICKEIILPGMMFVGRDVLEDDGQITEYYFHSGICPKYQLPYPDSGPIGGIQPPWYTQLTTIQPLTTQSNTTGNWFWGGTACASGASPSNYSSNLTASGILQAQNYSNLIANQQMAQQQYAAYPPITLTPYPSASSPLTPTGEDLKDSWIKRVIFKIFDIVLKRKETHETEKDS